MGLPVQGRVAGIDLMAGVLDLRARHGYRPHFQAPSSMCSTLLLAKCGAAIRELNAGARNGYFGSNEEADIVEDIRASGADCLFVGIASPIKESFLNRYRDRLGVPVSVGSGRLFRRSLRIHTACAGLDAEIRARVAVSTMARAVSARSTIFPNERTLLHHFIKHAGTIPFETRRIWAKQCVSCSS